MGSPLVEGNRRVRRAPPPMEGARSGAARPVGEGRQGKTKYIHWRREGEAAPAEGGWGGQHAPTGVADRRRGRKFGVRVAADLFYGGV
jgi:hypothetical protein